MSSGKDRKTAPPGPTIKSIIHIYTGQGKGKTTAAVGLAVRAKSRGLKVLFAQFMKDTEGGELEVLERLSITVRRYREVKSPLFHPDIPKEDLQRATRAALQELSALSRDYDLIVIDEFNCLLRENLISIKQAKEFIQTLPEGRDIVLTGRGAPEELIALGHYVTEMRLIKHPKERGLEARIGIEY